jgi:hypothetical protein
VGPGLWVMTDRYEGKPFLRLLECYVLWSVDQLSQRQAVALEEMAPKLAATYGADGTWQEIVAARMEFPPDLPAALRGMWERTLANAGDQRVTVDPELWAQQVVDSNFT